MPATIDLTELLRSDDVHLHFAANSVIDAIPLLLRPALERRLHDSNVVDQIVDAAVKREADTSTRCGSLSLPHARSSAISDFIVSLGANSGGVITGFPEPRLIFAFVSPEGRREQHLQLLAALARLSQNARVVDEIAGATNADQVIETLRGAM